MFGPKGGHPWAALCMLTAVLSLSGVMICLLKVRPEHASTLRVSQLTSWSTLSAILLPLRGREEAPPADMLTAAATVHGWVDKVGPLNLRYWHDNFQQYRQQQFRQWFSAWRSAEERRRERQEQQQQQQQGGEQQQGAEEDAWDEWDDEEVFGAPGGDGPLREDFTTCLTYVSHRYKFLYLRLTKTGSTSLVDYLTECSSPNPGPACIEVLSESTPAEEVDRIWREYFVFAVVRNPYQRALSLYKFLVGRMRAEDPACGEPVTWDGFCADPLSLGQYCQQAPQCCARSQQFYYQHARTQVRCMLAAPAGGGPGGTPAGWAVDYIARTEQLDEDMVDIIAEIDRRRPPGMPAIAGGLGQGRPKKLNVEPACGDGGSRRQPAMKTVPKTNVTYLAAVPREQYCDTEQYFTGGHAACLRAVEQNYRDDLDWLWGGALASNASAGGSRGSSSSAGGGPHRRRLMPAPGT